MKGYIRISLSIIIITLLAIYSCQPVSRARTPTIPNYKALKDSLQLKEDRLPDSSNIFDDTSFLPGTDSLESLLKKMDTAWRNELLYADTLRGPGGNILTDTGVTRLNLQALDSFLAHHDEQPHLACREMDCIIYAEVIKSTQTLYLYIDGELADSFKVSTGKGKYETPSFSVKPSGPIFRKYTSRKFPGGNYKGLGNMPYAVFVKGGYAIHGTTPGNFSKLGTRASHGCIRLHPDNAIIFNELVKRVGLDFTWVTVKDSL